MTVRRLLYLITLLTLLSIPAWANQSAQGYCQDGGQRVFLSGLTSSNFVQQSFPSCTVTVRRVSDGGIATIFSDNSSTPLANPFTADNHGHWQFYAANNRYSISLTGAGISGTVTIPDILLNDPAGGGGTVTSVFGRTGAVIAQSGDYDCTLITNAACLTSPTFLGVPTAPTAAPGTNTTQLATTAFVQAFSPTAPVTSVFSRTGVITANTGDYSVSQVTGAAPLASPTFTGIPVAPTATLGTNTTQIASTAFVQTAVSSASAPVTSVFGRTGAITTNTGDYTVSQITGAAPLASPTLTGTPTAPTAPLGDNSTIIPTTAWVKGQNYLTTALTGPPIYLNAGAPLSQGNECSLIVTDSNGGTVTTAAALRTIDASNVGHDVTCVVLTDTANPSNIGSLVWAGINSFSSTSASTQLTRGLLESIGNGSTSTSGLILTNNSGTTRTSSIDFRGCTGPGATGCGTDLSFIEDPTSTAKQEFTLNLIGDGTPLYLGNVLNSTHPGIWMGGSNASTGAVFGFDRVSGKLSHLVRLSSDTDVWSTATLSAGTVSITFDRAFTSTPICITTWQGGGTLTGILKCTPSTTGITIVSSVGSDTAVVGYLILGNNQ